jgi:hypothetical protein
VLPVSGLIVYAEAQSIIAENGGKEFHFLGEGILVTESCGSVYKGSED